MEKSTCIAVNSLPIGILMPQASALGFSVDGFKATEKLSLLPLIKIGSWGPKGVLMWLLATFFGGMLSGIFGIGDH